MPAKRQSPEERILGSIKWLDFTFSLLKDEMNANAGTFEGPLHVDRLRGSLRLVIRCRHVATNSWAMSLILNNDRFDGRIDCIDWEPSYVSTDGIQCTGFHRHLWKAKDMSCDDFKVPLVDFLPKSAEEFVTQGLKLLNVVLRNEESRNASLSL